MEDADFSDEFCRFVQQALPSVDAAELLLLLARDPATPWRAREAAERLPGANEGETARYLQAFQSAGLAAASDHAFQYRPASAALAAHVATLAKAYEERPVTLFRLIYALRDRKFRSFADAFKLRDPKD